MPNFSYKALGRDGKEVRGVLQAESEAAAASQNPGKLSDSSDASVRRKRRKDLMTAVSWRWRSEAGGSRRRSWRSCVRSLRSLFIRV